MIYEGKRKKKEHNHTAKEKVGKGKITERKKERKKTKKQTQGHKNQMNIRREKSTKTGQRHAEIQKSHAKTKKKI